MADERLSVAPMLDCTTRHWRYMMRGITRKSVLYTEMVVDSTIIFRQQNLAPFLRHDFHLEQQGGGDTVVQLGGFDPADMATAAGLVNDYTGARFAEMNINCGCPSAKVVEKCFGAKLMLDPPLVGRICSQVLRRVSHSCPVTVKCRIGADDRDQYHHLREFVQEVRDAGVRKFIVHARKCHLNGLSTKQNRSVPPLQYEVVHRLAAEFPELQVVLNGGLQTLGQVDYHTNQWEGEDGDEGGRVRGCMLGRAVFTNPYLFSRADSTVYGSTDQLLCRGDVLQRYYDYCDRIAYEDGGGGVCDQKQEEELEQEGQEEGTSVLSRGQLADEGGARIGKILDAAKHLFHSCPGAARYRQRLKSLYSEEIKGRKRRAQGFLIGTTAEGSDGSVNPALIIQQAISETIRAEDLEDIPQDSPS